MEMQEFKKRLEELAEIALEAHEITATAMILEQSEDMAEKLYTIGNAKREQVWVQLVLLDKERGKHSGGAGDWTKLKKSERKCISLAQDISFYVLLIEDLLAIREDESEFAKELDGLQDLVTDREFELQYRMIKFVNKQRRGW